MAAASPTPLRDRPVDIRAFAEYFAERAADRFGLRPVAVSEEDVRLLAAYHWPGNVREMAAVMDRAALIGQGRTLSVAAALGQSPVPVHTGAARVPKPGREAVIDPLDDVIRRHVEAALRETRGRIEGRHGAAQLLRINPHTLRARMRKLKIDWRAFRQQDSESGGWLIAPLLVRAISRAERRCLRSDC